MSAPRFPHLPAEAWAMFLEDALPEASELSLEAHLDECAECRRVLEEADPSRLFRRLRGLELRPGALEGLWSDVRDEIRRDDRPARPRRSERLGLLAGAASLVVALLLLSLPARTPEPGTRAGAPAPAACARWAHLGLSRDECRDLFVEARFDGEPTLFVEGSADLAELL